jgi:NADH-quinone oxidoreductase subunit G
VRALAGELRGAGKEVVILYGEQLLDGDAGGVLALAEALGIAGREGAGLIGLPSAANGRGLREAGVAPNAGPGLSRAPLSGGADAPAIAAKLAGGELAALYLLGVDPLLSYPDARLWEAALDRATTVIAHASFLTVGVRAHATVVFPAEVSAEKEGTVTHPDGRVQRLRPAVGRGDEVGAEWRVLTQIATRLGADLGVESAAGASAELFRAVGFYQSLTLEALAGRGMRWPETAAAAALPAPGARAAKPRLRRALAVRPAALKLGSYRSIWAGPEVRFSPALAFLSPSQQVELAPHDAAKLGLRHGEEVIVSDEHGELRAKVALRDSAPAGTAFLEQTLARDGANLLRGPHVKVRAAATVPQHAAALPDAEGLTRA